ncbi:MAG TPA: radical SAM protein [Desulfomonilaceae bacterium]|nr:radical SAM protein [Desulfomonilaceae bacterium]
MISEAKSVRVLLVSVNREEINMATWPLGLACVATATANAGHDVALLDLMQEPDPYAAIEHAVRKFNPEVIGVSVRNVDDQQMQDTKSFLGDVKNLIGHFRTISSAPIVLGGAGYSIYPESALNYLGADIGIPGEGEALFLQLVERIGSDRHPATTPGVLVPGSRVAAKREFILNLDQFPLPDVKLISPAKYHTGEFWMPVQTRRGCPLKCSYCSTPAIEGLRLRKRSIHTVVHWLSECVASGINRFYFVDNTFNLPGSYARELCSAIAKADFHISWRCILYPAKMDEKLVELMARAGCVEVSLGFESGCETILEAMNKRFTPQDVRESTRLLARYGIRTMGFIMLGGPGETMDSAEQSLQFGDSLNLDAMKITLGIRIYPHTRLARQAVEAGIITSGDDLLTPRFYMVPELGEPLGRLVKKWMSQRPNWMM